MKTRGLSANQLLEKVGEKLRIARLNKSITQAKVASLCQCSILTIQKIEKGVPGVACLFLFRYLVAIGEEHLLDGFDEVQPFPTFEKKVVKYAKRARPKDTSIWK